jgi:RNA polymerase sigma-70 factor (ECF subfamily)
MLCEKTPLHLLFEQISLYSDQEAFAALFRAWYPKLYRFALQYVETPQAAEEVVNDVFVKLWKYRAHLHTVKHPESYLFIGVKNQSLNYIKQYSRLKVAMAGDALAQLTSQDSPQNMVEWKELYFRLNLEIDQLPEQCRTIFKLIKEEGLKPQQVAKILNLSVRTVETQLYRATKRLSIVLDTAKKKSARPHKK